MSITVQWINAEKTVLYLRFHNHWTLDDYYVALERANRWIEQAAYPVEVIADVRDVHTFPQGLITHARNALQSRPRNVRLAVVIITAPVVAQMYQSIIRFYKLTYPDAHVPLAMVKTLEAACQRVGVSTEVFHEIHPKNLSENLIS